MIKKETLYKTALELNHRTAKIIPSDAKKAVERLYKTETQELAKYVLEQIMVNYELAAKEQRPICADTGLPRFYVKIGNEAQIEGGMVALENIIRKATADAAFEIPL
jgi:L(+)-tartrate dehydratase alpha subunit